MNRIKSFFWLCAGANTAILSNTPSESSKYAGIGATIFFTGLFAGLSGAYALFTIFDNALAAIGFGLIWGLMIFNLDRFIVSSMRKNGNMTQEWFMAIPRIVLAVVISIVIAKPLELKVFEKEVNSEIALMEIENKTIRENTVKSRFIEDRERLNQEISGLKTEIQSKADKRDELRRIAQQEADGTGGTGKRNPGPVYRIKKADADKADLELKALELKNLPLIEEKISALKKLESEEKSTLADVEELQLTGLASRIEALDRLSAKHAAIAIAHWFIMLLFIAIETAPVVVKLISPRGPYDFVLKKEEYGYEAAYYEDLAKVNSVIKKRSSRLTAPELDYVINRLGLSLDKS